jgi:hypothetical protein
MMILECASRIPGLLCTQATPLAWQSTGQHVPVYYVDSDKNSQMRTLIPSFFASSRFCSKLIFATMI